jgi:prolipoprotein diacylglyceryltransferase
VPYGTVFALYVALYDLYRMPLETLKIDTADIVLGQRINFWVSAVLFVIGLVAFVLLFRRRHVPTKAPVAPAEPVEYGGHTPTPRPEAAIAARLKSQRKKKS